MGPVEIAALMIFAFSIITGLVGSSMIKGLIASALDILPADSEIFFKIARITKGQTALSPVAGAGFGDRRLSELFGYKAGGLDPEAFGTGDPRGIER